MNYTLTGSQYFSKDELLSKNKADEKKIVNTPTPAVILNLEYFKNKLDSYRKAWGKPIRMTNCYRSEALNKACGGVSNSVHMKGLAGDLAVPNELQNEFINILFNAGCKWHTLIIYPTRGFIHIDCREREVNLPCIVRISKGKEYPLYTGYKK